MDYLLLAIAWAAWCTVHSFLIAHRVTTYLKIKLGAYYRFYRLFYNIFAVLSLVPVYLYTSSLNEPIVYKLEGGLQILRFLLLCLAVFLFYMGSKKYSLAQFTGLYQIRNNNSSKMLSRSGSLVTGGVLGVVRHPWYLGGVLLLWARDLNVPGLIVNIILSLYLIFGAWLEEQKLLKEFGASYAEYRNKVSMFIPFRWLFSRKKRESAL